MRLLALDIGFARVGVAIGSDDIGIAFGHGTFLYSEYLEKVMALVRKENIKTIVIGDPKSVSGDNISAHRQKILEEKEKIEKACHVPVILWNEQFTTQLASRQLHVAGIHGLAQKGKKDTLAACALLQEYLDKKQQYNVISQTPRLKER